MTSAHLSLWLQAGIPAAACVGACLAGSYVRRVRFTSAIRRRMAEATAERPKMVAVAGGEAVRRAAAPALGAGRGPAVASRAA